MKWEELGITLSKISQTQRFQVQFRAVSSCVISTVNENLFICKHLKFFYKKTQEKKGAKGDMGRVRGGSYIHTILIKTTFNTRAIKQNPKETHYFVQVMYINKFLKTYYN